MIIYVFVFLLLVYYAWTYQKGRINKNSLIPFLILFMMVALRDKSVGIDTQNYVDTFIHGSNSSLKTESEIGYYYWMEFLKTISKSGEWFLFATACLSLFPLFYCIKKNSLNVYLSLLLFLIYEGGVGLYMNAIRQTIAASFCVLAFFLIDFKNKRSLIIVSLLIVFASLFHTSALTCFAFVLFSLIPLSSKAIKILLLGISVLVGLIVRLNFFSFLPDILQIGLIADNASFYGDYATYEADLNFNGLITEIIPVSLLLFFVINYSKDTPIHRICFWSVILANVFANTPFLPRFFIYGILPLIILVPNCYNSIKPIGKTILNVFIIIVFLFFLFFSTVNNGIDDYKLYMLQ